MACAHKVALTGPLTAGGRRSTRTDKAVREVRTLLRPRSNSQSPGSRLRLPYRFLTRWRSSWAVMLHAKFPLEGRAPKRRLEHAREHERASVSFYCQTKIGSGCWSLALIEDLSTHGFQIRRPPGANVGTSLKIQVPGLEMLMVTVKWVTEAHAGCAFEKPLSPYVFEHIVRQANG